jgi:hypothetical protein
MLLYRHSKGITPNKKEDKIMKKLTSAQARVIEEAKKDIDRARSLDFKDWCGDRYNFIMSDAYSLNLYTDFFNKAKAGTVLTQDVNSRTLAKLEELGLIKIVYDSKGTHSGIDTITLLNY